MDINYYKKYEPIDGKWYLKEQIGSGAFGVVYEAERHDFDKSKSAIKIITIPASQNEVRNYRAENYDLDEASITSYFYGFVEEFKDEFQLMTKLKGNSNIVSIEDYSVIKHEDEIGWDIFIRMELLTPLNTYFRENGTNEADVIRLGIDICKALEVCQQYKIIHRDIKPSNLFVSPTGDFKLGDFGVARTLEKTSSGLSKKGTYTYMAPEVYKGEEYGSTVDIYSLGIVMYRLLNNNAEPFRKGGTHTDEENALHSRMSGKKFPKPVNASEKLSEIILKACSYNPKDRYKTPKQMRERLEQLLQTREDEEKSMGFWGKLCEKLKRKSSSKSIIEAQIENDEVVADEEETVGPFERTKKDERTIGPFPRGADTEPSEPGTTPLEPKKKKHNAWKYILAALVSLVLLGVMAFGVVNFLDDEKIESIENVMADVVFANESNSIRITNDDISKIHKVKQGNESYIQFILQDRGKEKLTDSDEKLHLYINGEDMLSDISTLSNENMVLLNLPTMDNSEIETIVEKLKTEKVIDGTELNNLFLQANEYLTSVKESKDIDLNNITFEVQALEGALSECGFSLPDGIAGLTSTTSEKYNKYNDIYKTKVVPAIDALKTAYDKALEIKNAELDDLNNNDNNDNTDNSNTQNEVKKCPVCGSTSHTVHPQVKPCPVCGSTSHTVHPQPKCPVCGSTSHTTHPTCPTCGSTSHTVHPTCPVCGSTYHTVHPNDEKPTIVDPTFD